MKMLQEVKMKASMSLLELKSTMLSAAEIKKLTPKVCGVEMCGIQRCP